MTIIELPDDQAAILRANATAQGLTLEDWFRTLAATDESLSETRSELATATSQLPLSSRIRDIWKDMSADDRAEYPEGGAYQIDHHVYGLPK